MNPAFIDTDQFLPAGGVNGFELNGHAVNEPGFVDNPFFGVVFVPDPLRSLLDGERGGSQLSGLVPSALAPPVTPSVTRPPEEPAKALPPRSDAALTPEISDSLLSAEVISAVSEPAGASVVRPENRTSLVPPQRRSDTSGDRRYSGSEGATPSRGPDDVITSVVPKEDRRTLARRNKK